MPQATPAESEDNALGFSFPAIGGKKLTAAFDGGRLTSDGGVLLLAQAERAMGICQRLAECIDDPRDPARVVHRLDAGAHRLHPFAQFGLVVGAAGERYGGEGAEGGECGLHLRGGRYRSVDPHHSAGCCRRG